MTYYQKVALADEGERFPGIIGLVTFLIEGEDNANKRAHTKIKKNCSHENLKAEAVLYPQHYSAERLVELLIMPGWIQNYII